MLPFESPKLDDADVIRGIVRKGEFFGNDLNFVNLFLYRNKHRITVCVRDGVLYRHYNGERLRGYAVPVGLFSIDTIAAIEEDAQNRGRSFTFCLMTREQAESLETIRPGQFRYSSDRGDADYLYLRNRLASLSGRKFHRKRNAVHRFQEDSPDWKFLPMTEENATDSLKVAGRWFEAHDVANDPSLYLEREAIHEAVDHFTTLNLTGGLLYNGKVPIAMSIASRTTEDVYNIHFEKVIPGWPLAYSVLCHETARSLTSARRINREEDLNHPGLRTSKLSWFPDMILMKYRAEPILK